MKNIIIAIIVIAIIEVACNKQVQNNNTPTANANTKKTRQTNAPTVYDSINTTKCKEGPCVLPKSNCIKMSLYEPCGIAHIQQLDHAAMQGSAAVGQLFSSSAFSFVTNRLHPTFVSKLQSGNYGIRKNYESTTVVNYDAGSILPVTNENAEFTFELNK